MLIVVALLWLSLFLVIDSIRLPRTQSLPENLPSFEQSLTPRHDPAREETAAALKRLRLQHPQPRRLIIQESQKDEWRNQKSMQWRQEIIQSHMRAETTVQANRNNLAGLTAQLIPELETMKIARNALTNLEIKTNPTQWQVDMKWASELIISLESKLKSAQRRAGWVETVSEIRRGRPSVDVVRQAKGYGVSSEPQQRQPLTRSSSMIPQGNEMRPGPQQHQLLTPSNLKILQESGVSSNSRQRQSLTRSGSATPRGNGMSLGPPQRQSFTRSSSKTPQLQPLPE